MELIYAAIDWILSNLKLKDYNSEIKKRWSLRITLYPGNFLKSIAL